MPADEVYDDSPDVTNVGALRAAEGAADAFSGEGGTDPLAELARLEAGQPETQAPVEEPAAPAEDAPPAAPAPEPQAIPYGWTEDGGYVDTDGQYYAPEVMEDVQLQQQEQWENLVEEDPEAAVQMLAEAYQEQLRGEVLQELDPILQHHKMEQLTADVSQLESEFGDVFDRHRVTLAEVVGAAAEAGDHSFTNPATRAGRLREALMAAEYARMNGIDWQAASYQLIRAGADAAAGINGAPAYDAFGNVRAPAAPGTPQVAGLSEQEVLALQSGRIPEKLQRADSRSVHVEGGSTPPPPQRRPAQLDPDIPPVPVEAARDAFGPIARRL